MTVRVAILPEAPEPLLHAVARGGGALVADPTEAEALIWVNPGDPDGLARAVQQIQPKWVQLPFAGVEQFVAAGAIDNARIWTCAKGIYGATTAEHALALTLLAARELQRSARAKSWEYGVEKRRLDGTTALMIGTGGIGRAYAHFAAPFGMRIIALNRSGTQVPWAERTVASGELLHVIGDADWVVLAAALTDETRDMIGHDALSVMRREAWLINVARGGLVDTDALVDALRDQRIGGAALDVTEPQPLPDGHPLWTLPNAIITSHTANTFALALPELASLVERNVRHYAAGEQLEGLVDPSLGY